MGLRDRAKNVIANARKDNLLTDEEKNELLETSAISALGASSSAFIIKQLGASGFFAGFAGAFASTFVAGALLKASKKKSKKQKSGKEQAEQHMKETFQEEDNEDGS